MKKCNYCNGRIFKKNENNNICNKCIKKYKCSGKGECFNMKCKKMYECPYKCKLKQCKKCFNDIPEVYLIMHGEMCVDCKVEEIEENNNSD